MSRINTLMSERKTDNVSGNARTIIEYDNNLLKRGHKVNIFISVSNRHPRQFS